MNNNLNLDLKLDLNRLAGRCLHCVTCLVVALAACGKLGAQTPIYFEDAVAPILRKNCIACHNTKIAEGGLNLENPANITKGGDTGSSIDAANIDMSLLIKRATETEDPMPPVDNTVGAEKLTMDQLNIIRAWIAGGALSKGTAGGMPSLVLKLPESARASYALAVSRDNDFVAFGRGGQLVIHNARRLATAQSVEGMLSSTPTQVISNAHPDFIHSIAISEDGERIATGSTGQVKIWKHVNNSIESSRVALETAGIPISNLLCTSVDGKLLATVKKRAQTQSDPASEKAPGSTVPGILTMLNRSGEIVQSIEVADSSLVCGTWSPSNQRFFAVGANNMLYAWDLQAMPIAPPTASQLPSAIQSLDSIDETTLLTFSERKVSVWKYNTPAAAENVPTHPLAVAINAAGPIDLANVSPDRTKLIVATQVDSTNNTSMKLWNIPTAKLVGTIERDRKSQLAYLNADRLVRRAQGAVERSNASVTELEKALTTETTAVTAAKAAKDKAAEALAKKEQERLAAVQAIADHEKTMLETKAAIEAATLKLTQLTTELEPKKKMATDLEKQKKDSQAAMDNAAQSLAATEETLKAAQVRLDSRKQLVTKESEELASVKTKSESLKAQSEMVKFSAHAIAFADANTIAAVRVSASQNTDKASLIDLFSAETLERIDTQSVSYPIHSNAALMAPVSDPTVQGIWQQERLIDSAKIIVDRVTALAFSPDGSKLAMGSGLSSRTGQLAIVNVNDGSPIPLPSDSASTALGDTLDLHSDTILGLSYSPDGRWLASCGADKMTKLMDTSNNKVVKIFEGHTHHVLALAWQDSGHQLATASADSTVKIWNIERGESVRTVTGFGTEVTALSFIGTTENMVSSTMNNLVRMHESGSGKQVKQFSPAGDSLYSVATTPNGKYVMSVGQEGIVRTWLIEDGRLVGEWK